MLFGVACGTAVTVWLELHRTKHESSTVKQHASCWRRCGVCQRLVGTPGSRKQSTSVRFATRQRRDNVNSLKRKDLTARRRKCRYLMQVLTCKAPWAETLDLCLQYCSGAKNCRQHIIKSRSRRLHRSTGHVRLTGLCVSSYRKRTFNANTHEQPLLG